MRNFNSGKVLDELQLEPKVTPGNSREECIMMERGSARWEGGVSKKNKIKQLSDA